MKTFKTIAVLASVYLGQAAVFTALAWDNPGHMAVAGLAYSELSGAQQQKLAAILRQHPGFNLIQEGFPSGDPDDRAVVLAAATWPDLAKRDTKRYHNNGYEEHDPAVTQVAYSTNMHKGYHFVDTPLWVDTGPAPLSLPPAPQVNATNVVNVLVAQLHTNEDDPAKAYDLSWLLHLVGDLHQPLHAATGITRQFSNGDVGGNQVHLKGVNRGDTDGESDLHAYWDDILGKTAKADKQTHHPRLDIDVTTADDIIASVSSLSAGGGGTSDKLDPAVWAKESFNMAKRDVYDVDLEVVPTDRGDILRAILDDHYHQMAVKDARKRIRLAGHRLALLLNDIL